MGVKVSPLTIVVGVPQGPGLIGVKVRVPSYARAWEIGVGEESPLPVEGRAVAVKAWSEDDGDVHVTPARLQGAVRNGLEAQGRHALPHVKRPADGVVSLPGTNLWRDIFNAVERGERGVGGSKEENAHYLIGTQPTDLPHSRCPAPTVSYLPSYCKHRDKVSAFQYHISYCNALRTLLVHRNQQECIIYGMVLTSWTFN